MAAPTPPAAPLVHYAHAWLQDRASRVRPATLRIYGQAVRLYVPAALGSQPIDRVGATELRTLFGMLRAAGRSAATVRILAIVLAGAYRLARIHGVDVGNPVADAREMIGSGRKAIPPDRALRRAEVVRFLDALGRIAPTPAYTVLFLVLARTGIRAGEALALRVDDVDLVRRRLRIDETFSRGVLGPPKGGVVRTVDLSHEAVAVLGRWIAGKAPRAWLFPGRDPTLPLTGSHVGKVTKRVLEAAGLPRRHSPKSFRHGWATTLLEERLADMHYVQRELGHSTVTTTISCYARYADPHDPAIVDQLDSDRAKRPPLRIVGAHPALGRDARAGVGLGRRGRGGR